MTELAAIPVHLQMLVWSSLLCLFQFIAYALGNAIHIGLAPLLGNRENLVLADGWAGRAKRAHVNMLESLPVFAAIVLAAHVAGRIDEISMLGAQLFFWGRLSYAVIYIAGITYLRTLAWGVAVTGIVLIARPLLG
jgi:uncharacterized MAPEG superfamily protein